ncbi:MAG: hypothetical protein AAFR29_10115, partial [Pseudomonadota bacterium]
TLMGLIEKAFQVNARPAKSVDAGAEQAGMQPRAEIIAALPGAQLAPGGASLSAVGGQGQGQGAHTAEKEFELPVRHLAAAGFYMPQRKSSRLALELRLLKRRLLRRIGYLRTSAPLDAGNRRQARQRNTIMVTSTRPAEGKTFTAINLALSLALEDEVPVLLVDGDAPRPKVQTHLGLNDPRGLSDLIRQPQLHPAALSYRARGTSLTVLPEGGPVDHAAELFGSNAGHRTFSMLSQWRSEQIVIIDAPPVLATTEAVVLGSLVDEIIFVVEADATPEPAIASAIEELLDVNPNISLVLNKTLIGAGGSHYGSYSDYYPRGARAAARDGQRD